MSIETINNREQSEWVWALVGNIVEEHKYGPEHEVRKGTKHFGPGTKVFLSKYGYDSGIPVIGHPRHGKNYITVFVKYDQIENYRLQKVYKPEILKIMAKEHKLASFYDNSEESRMLIIKRLDWLNPEVAKQERKKILRYEIMYGDIEDYCVGYFSKHFDIHLNAEQKLNTPIKEVLNNEQLKIFFTHMNSLLNISCVGDKKFDIEKTGLLTLKDFYHEIIKLLDHYPSNFDSGWFNPHVLSTKKWNRIENI